MHAIPLIPLSHDQLATRTPLKLAERLFSGRFADNIFPYVAPEGLLGFTILYQGRNASLLKALFSIPLDVFTSTFRATPSLPEYVPSAMNTNIASLM